MGSAFDPYYLWLGIPPEEQPPDHYRLLGLARFEDDPDVIEQAAERQLQFVRQMLSTPQRELALKIQREIQAARVVLLNPPQKQAYDAQLRRTLGLAEPLPAVNDPAGVLRQRFARQPLGKRLVAPLVSLWTHPATTAGLAVALFVASALLARFVPPKPVLRQEAETATQVATPDAASRQTAEPAGPAGEPSDTAGHLTASPQPPAPPRVPGSAGQPSPSDALVVPAQSLLPPQPPASPGSPELPVAAEVPLLPGLLGRLMVNGEDLGVLLRYTPGEAVGAGDVTRLITQYGLQPGQQKLRLTGIIRVNRSVGTALPLRVGIDWEAGRWGQISLSIDGRALTIPVESQQNSWNASLALPPGDHPIECLIQGDTWAAEFRLVVEALGATATTADTPPAAAQPGMPPFLVGYSEATLREVTQLPTLARHALNASLSPLTPQDFAVATPPPGETVTGPSPPETAPPPATQRWPVPLAREENAARSQLREEFRKDYQEASTPAAKTLLARTLLGLGNREKDPVRRYALYQEARELAIQGGSVELAVQTGEALALNYELDVWPLHLAAIQTIAKSARTAQAREELPGLIEPLIQSAISEDCYNEALALIDLCANLASQLRDGYRREQFARRRDEVRAMASAYEAVLPQLETLRANPEDRPANEAVGRFYCFVKGDWQRGLPHLARAETTLLRTVAQAELNPPLHPSAQLQLGDDWWAIADTLGEKEKAAARRRAGHWYLRCEGQISGEAAQRIRSLLAESGRLINLLSLAATRRVSVQGSWQLSARAITSGPEPVTQLVFHTPLPEEYDLRLEIQALPLPTPPRQVAQGRRSNPLNDVGRGAFAVALVQGRHHFLAVLDWSLPNQGSYCFLANVEGRGPDPANPTMQSGGAIRSQSPNIIVYQVRKSGVTVLANNMPLIRYTGDFSRLSMPQGWGPATAGRLFFATRSAVYQITQAELRDVTP